MTEVTLFGGSSGWPALAAIAALVLVGVWIVIRRFLLRRGRGAALASTPGGLEMAALILLLVGGFFLVGWLVGCILLWVSPRWRWTDKLLATVVWPGGLVPAWLVSSAAPSLLGQTCVSGLGEPTTCFHMGPPTWIVITALVVLIIGPLAVAARLWRKACRSPGQDVTSGSAAPAA